MMTTWVREEVADVHFPKNVRNAAGKLPQPSRPMALTAIGSALTGMAFRRPSVRPASLGPSAAMNRDFDLQQKVIDALVAEPGIDPADVAVTVVDGVVSLYGFVGRYAEKAAAEQVARSTSGVEAISDELRVRHARDAGTTLTPAAGNAARA